MQWDLGVGALRLAAEQLLRRPTGLDSLWLAPLQLDGAAASDRGCWERSHEASPCPITPASTLTPTAIGL